MADLSLDLGRFFGVDIQLHWTFMLVLLIAAFYGILSLIVILFIFVVIHELAHSVTSLRNGIKVKKIVLIPLGGASIIDLDEANPATALKIALAGPMMSILLGILFGVLALSTTSKDVYQIFYAFSYLNFALGIFNLLPAFPLDGGRVLKSYLERKHNEFDATKIAVQVSKAILGVLVIGSIIYLFTLPASQSQNFTFVVLWDFVIFMFVYTGAQNELEGAYITKYTSNIKVAEATTKNYVMVSPNATMKQIYKILLKRGTHLILFPKDGRINIVSRLTADPFSRENRELLGKKVAGYGTELPEIEAKEPLSKALRKMRYEETGIMVVTKKGKMTGILYAPHVEAVIALHLPHTSRRKE